jgi:hypothetical protein
LDEVARSGVGPVRRAGKAGLRVGMSAMRDHCIMQEGSIGQPSEGLHRALGGWCVRHKGQEGHGGPGFLVPAERR